MAYDSLLVNLGHSAIFFGAHGSTLPVAPVNTRVNAGYVTKASLSADTEDAGLDVAIFGLVDQSRTSLKVKLSCTLAEMTLVNFVRAMGGRESDIVTGAVDKYLGGLMAAIGEWEIQLCSPIAREMSTATLATTKCDQVLTVWRCRAESGFTIDYDPKAYKLYNMSFTGLVRNPSVASPTANATSYRLDTPGSGDLIADLSASGHGYSLTD